MKWFLGWCFIGCIFVGLGEGYKMAKCPDDEPTLLSTNSLIGVGIWPAFIAATWMVHQYPETIRPAGCKSPVSLKKQDRLPRG